MEGSLRPRTLCFWLSIRDAKALWRRNCRSLAGRGTAGTSPGHNGMGGAGRFDQPPPLLFGVPSGHPHGFAAWAPSCRGRAGTTAPTTSCPSGGRSGENIGAGSAYNEAKTIGSTLDSLAAALPRSEVVVIDDGVTDGTGDVAAAREFWSSGTAATWARRLRWPGGCRSAREMSLPWWMPIWEPLGREILPLIEAVVRGRCHMAVARFASSRGGGLGLVRNLARWGICLCTGVRLQAPLSGQRAACRSCWSNACRPEAGHGLETELTLRALRPGCRVLELPTGVCAPGYGWRLAGIRHWGRQFFHVLRALWRGGAGGGRFYNGAGGGPGPGRSDSRHAVPGLAAKNYRGELIPTGMGLVFLMAVLAGLGALVLLGRLDREPALAIAFG